MVSYIKDQRLFSFTIALVLAYPCLLSSINAILNHVHLNTTIDTIAIFIIVAIAFAYAIVRSLRRVEKRVDVLCMLIGPSLLLALSYILSPIARKYINLSPLDITQNTIYNLIVFSTFTYVLVRKLISTTYLVNFLYIFSYPVIILTLVVYFICKDSSANQYMVLSYNLLLSLTFLTLFKEKYKRIPYIILFCLGFFVLFFGGARGPLFGYILSLIIYNLYTHSFRTIIIVSLLALITFLFQDELIRSIANILESLNIESRNFDFIKGTNSGNITSSRDILYARCLNESSMVGFGIFADREIAGIYAHNLFIELIVNYGYVLGSILSFSITFVIIFAIIKSNREMKKLILSFLPSGYIGMMFSGSYLLFCPSLYILLALCVNEITNNLSDDDFQLTKI